MCISGVYEDLDGLNPPGTCNLNYLGKLKPQLFYQGKIILGKSCLPRVVQPQLLTVFSAHNIIIVRIRVLAPTLMVYQRKHCSYYSSYALMK